MRKPWRKIALALLLSLGCFAATHLIYKATAPDRGASGDRIPIAYVSEVKNEVDRRPLKRSIWQELSSGEPVYPGEAIRTAENSEAQIRFVGGSRRLDLEPDSLIVITKSADEIALELLDGSVFVAQTEAPKDNPDAETASSQTLTLKSQSGNVDLSKATASLSKSLNSAAVDLQILKGTAQIQTRTGEKSIGQGQSSSLSEQGAKIDTTSVQLLSPKHDEPIFVAIQNPVAQEFAWSGGPDKTRAELWLGTQRKNLVKRADLPAHADSREGKIRQVIKPGKYFWKIVFTDTSGTKSDSTTMRLDIRALPAPPLLQPARGEFITLENEGIPIHFQWSSPEGSSEITLEFSDDPVFSKVLFSEKLKADVGGIDRSLPTGKYTWRASAYYPEYDEVIASAPQAFEVWVKPPKVINITWNPDKTIYFPIDPSVKFTWEATADPDIKKWRMKIADTEEALKTAEALQVESDKPSVVTGLPKPGRYIAAIEALDKNNKVLSKSAPRSFELALLPLIEPVMFKPADGPLKASNAGELNLTWQDTPGAKSYTLILKNSAGRRVASQTLTKTKTGLTDLMPGTYQVEIFAVDEFGRKSTPGPFRSVVVPDSSGLSAPKVKSIKVNR